MVELEQSYPQIKKQGLGLIAVSYDSVAVLDTFANRSKITFPLLSDPDSAVIRKYGILNEAVPKESPTYGIPHPGIYILDAKGKIVAKYFQEDYRNRDTAASILLRQYGVTPPAPESLDAKHAKLRASSSASSTSGEIRPSQRLTLFLDVELPKRVHVYAPGVQNYKPVALSLANSPAIKADPIEFPAAKTINLKAIKETVPAYEGRFRLMDTITLAPAQQLEPLLDANRNLTLKGEFTYQACDDKQCFVPETVPVTWVLKVLPFDRTRAPAEMQRQARKP